MFERVLGWLLVGVLCSTVATCGQKGPLELPDEQAAVFEYRLEQRSTVGDGLVPARAEPVATRVAGGEHRSDEIPRIGSIVAMRGESDGIRT